MTKDEAKAMEGTEFIYVFKDGDTMPAYVKKVDIDREVMSCWSFSLTTDQGYEFEPKNDDEKKEGAVCVCSPTKWERITSRLEEIKATGRLREGCVGRFNGCQL